jgi:hypothetical protein
MAAIRTRGGLLVDTSLGHSHDAQSCHALRIDQIDRTVAALGVVAALDRYEAAEAVLRKQAREAQARGHEGAAAGFLAAAAYTHTNVALLVERHG